MNKNSEEAAGLLIVFLLLAFWLCDFLPFRSEVTLYHASCLGKMERGICDSQEKTSIQITYKADYERQTVIYWIDDGAPNKYENCAVRNASNWKCNYVDEFEKTSDQMVNGEFKVIIGNKFWEFRTTKFEPWYVVPKWKWWLIRLKQH